VSFREIIGQEVPLTILKNNLRSDRIAHAYLFVGENSIGKRLTALNLAKVLNCEKGKADACDQCSSCQRIERFRHPDVKWLEPDGVSQTIKIDHILELQREIYLKPFEGRTKVFILLEAERMNRQAANAFLKTLEEPPGESVLILLSSAAEELLPTIRSRCQLVRFSLISQKKIEKFLLENLNCSLTEARSLSVISEGKLGEAVRFKKEGAVLGKEIFLDLILKRDDNILDIVSDIVETWDEHKKKLNLKYSGDLKEETENLGKKKQRFLEEKKKASLDREYRKKIEDDLQAITLFFRDCLVWKITGEETLIVNRAREDAIKETAQALSREEVKEKISVLKEIKEAVSRNAHLRLALTVMLLKLDGKS